MYIEIKNFINDGTCDYKNLNINLIVPGTQIYPDAENVAYFEYNGDTTATGDIKVLTKEDYEVIKDIFLKNLPRTKEQILEEKVANLEKENAQINYVLMMAGCYNVNL